jgi:16S rRNA (cytidine1402-2'-O)-methyltransferase
MRPQQNRSAKPTGGENIEAATTAASLRNRTRAEPNEAARSKQAEGSAAPGLYLVATPIGHAQDLTLRARDLLGRVDAIVCEDSRVTAKLLAIHGIRAPLIPYHEHNAERMRPALLARLRAGEALALVSDAGTPLISDPGYKLARAAIAEDIAVTTLPGASAPLAALLLSGLPTDRFLFAGFLPAKAAARRVALAELRPVPATLIWFESGPRLADSLAAARDILGDRPAAVARELTKLHEEVRRGSLDALARHYREADPPRGEIVVVAGAAQPEAMPDEAELDAMLRDALTRSSVKEAASTIAAATGMPRRAVYARALVLSRGDA